MLVAPENDGNINKSGNISDLGSRVIKEYHKPNPFPKASPRPPSENSVDVDNEVCNSSRSLKIVMKRRRSKTGDEFKGLGLKTKQLDNFIEEQEESSHMTELA